jgi:SRSO17 transposase
VLICTFPSLGSETTERRERTHVPSDIVAQTKQEIAFQLIDQALHWQGPFNVIVADAGYGRNAGFLKGREERQLQYVCGVECTFGVRRPEEVALAQQLPPPPRTGKNGRPRKAHPAPLYPTGCAMRLMKLHFQSSNSLCERSEQKLLP